MPLAYRPEIDGLRAVAVIAVLIYHANFVIAGYPLLQGGYIGVDVFFVISGYLITSIIAKGLREGSFSFTQFYLRRARRILPALLLVLLCTTLAAVALMRFEALREYYATALAALWSVSNFAFWKLDGYYAAPSELKPLLHTWSLGVEEQFYLLFPILLALLYRFFRQRMIVILAALLVASLALAQYGSQHFPDANFYLLPTRAWELLAGALLALIGQTSTAQINPRLAWLSNIGLALIFIPLFLFNKQTQHPALITLLPISGALLTIWFGGGTTIATRFLRSKAMVFIGLISYGLYLWHFPLFSLYRYALGEPAPLMKLGLLLLSFILAALSFYLFERPLRFSKTITAPLFVKGAVLAVFSLSGLAVLGYAASSRTGDTLNVKGKEFNLTFEKDKRFSIISEDCQLIGLDGCAQVQNDKINILIIGDSLVDDAYNILSMDYPDYHFIRSTLGGCPPHPDLPSLLTFELPSLQECLALNKARFNPESLAGIDGVVIDSLYYWFAPSSLVPYLDFLREAGMDNIMLFGNYLALRQNMAESFGIFTGNDAYADLVNSGLIMDELAAFENELEGLAKRYGAEFISLRQPACKAGSCTVFVEGYPYTWDQWHFSLEFSRYLSELLAPRLRETWLNAPN
ncbi:MAG: acyltransferase [Pseudomonadales bacterium]|jgi:peptidoglycan/LPS O-acetylase OafA/YrhL|nr:acyltransferase [Pseudomonadales bacterium]